MHMYMRYTHVTIWAQRKKIQGTHQEVNIGYWMSIGVYEHRGAKRGKKGKGKKILFKAGMRDFYLK